MVGGEVGGRDAAVAVDEREVVGQVERQAVKGRDRLGNRGAGLEQVANDERDSEPVPDVAASAERQR